MSNLLSYLTGDPVVKFFLAFAFVLGLIGVTAWAVRRFGSGRLGGVGLRGRQPRLAVIDHANVDGRRRLILVRRDNVEHLVMIGGPTDVVIESNIVRAAPAPRDIAVPRGPTIETPPRAIPLPDNSSNGAWPLQPDSAPASAPARAPRNEATEETASWPLQPQAETPPRPPRESLAALADELGPRPPALPRNRPQPSARPAAAEPRSEPRPPLKAEPRMPAPPPPAPAAAEPGPSIDQSLAEMAHKLEAALRKPKAERATAAPTPAAPAAETDANADATATAAAPTPPAPAARGNRAVEPKPARPETKQPNPGKALYDSLEQEMASLLGRPSAKN